MSPLINAITLLCKIRTDPTLLKRNVYLKCALMQANLSIMLTIRLQKWGLK